MMELKNISKYWHLLEAAKAGKQIQIRFEESDSWLGIDAVSFCEDPKCYRVKPEVRTQKYLVLEPVLGDNFRVAQGVEYDGNDIIGALEISVDPDTKKVSVKVIDPDD